MESPIYGETEALKARIKIQDELLTQYKAHIEKQSKHIIMLEDDIASARFLNE